MFRKLISDVSFSPSSIGALSPYAKLLKKEERTRFIGLVLLIIALLVQSVIIFAPTDPANTADGNDLLYGGISSQEDLLTQYDSNEQHLQDIYTSLGLERNDISTLHPGTIYFDNTAYVVSRQQQVGFDHGSLSHTYKKTGSGTGTIYLTPTNQINPNAAINSYASYSALIGQSASIGKFAVIMTSGNLVLQQSPINQSDTCTYNPKKTSIDATCQPCPSDPTTTVANESCEFPIVYTKSATNNTQGTIDTSVIANESDRITYTIRAKNIGDNPLEVTVQDQLRDVLEYATIIDKNGGTFDEKSQSIIWTPTTVQPNETISRSFVVRVKPHVPATAQNINNPHSFDCVMTNFNANTISIPVTCPPQKNIEQIATSLPFVPPTASLLLSSSVLAGALFLYLRARTQREEVRLVRKNINSGTIE